MYSIERTESKIIVRSGTSSSAIFTAPPDSLIVYRGGLNGDGATTVSKVKDLNDEALLLALVNVIEIKNFNGSK